MSSGKYFGPSGMASISFCVSRSMFSPVRAETEKIWSKWNSFSSASWGISFSGGTMSILLTARKRGQFMLWMSLSTALSPPPMRWPSTTASTASTPSRASLADFIMYSPSLVRGLCSPGVSTNTSCQSGPVATPRSLLRVVWGWLETMATFSPTMRFMMLDLPTFGRPRMATKPERNFLSDKCVSSVFMLVGCRAGTPGRRSRAAAPPGCGSQSCRSRPLRR